MSDEDDSVSSDGEQSESECGTRAPRLSEFGTSDSHAAEIQKAEEKEIILNSRDVFRKYLFTITETKFFSFGILGVIIINTVFIGIQTSSYVVAKADWYLTLIDNIFLATYVMELGMKFYVWRLKYFKSMWNVFDFVIVVASFIDFLTPLIVQNTANFNAEVFKVLRIFRAIRALRALRVLRTIRFLKNLQIIVSAVLQSIPAMGSIVILISLVLYIFAIIGRGLYSEIDPERFGNLARASFTLFQLITLDDWFYMYSDVRDKYPGHQHILLYLILFIILETFIFINLFVAVIVDNLARTQAAANASKKMPSLQKHKSEYESELDIREVHSKKKRHLLHMSCDFQRRREIEEFYSSDKYSESDRTLYSHYWEVLSSLEHHLQVNMNRQHTLDELVDLVDFANT